MNEDLSTGISICFRIIISLVRENKNVIRNKDQDCFRVMNIFLAYACTGSVFITVMPAVIINADLVRSDAFYDA